MRESSEGRGVKVKDGVGEAATTASGGRPRGAEPRLGLAPAVRRGLSVTMLAAAFFQAPRVSQAEDAKPESRQDAKQDAKSRYLSGQSHYNLNEFQEALQDFKEAYRMYADPAFLFNIAQCERQLGDHEEAIRFYRNYLRNKPQAPNRREVEHKIDELKALVEAKKTAAQGAPQSVIPPAVDDGPAPAPRGFAAVNDGGRSSEAARAQSSPAPAPSPSPAATTRPPTTSAAPATPPPPVAPPAPRPSLALASPPPSSASSSTAAATPAGVDLSASATHDGETPIYQRWWFWAGAAGVVAVGVVAAVALSGGGGASAPSSGLGNQKIF